MEIMNQKCSYHYSSH